MRSCTIPGIILIIIIDCVTVHWCSCRTDDIHQISEADDEHVEHCCGDRSSTQLLGCIIAEQPKGCVLSFDSFESFHLIESRDPLQLLC
jgi:hypothetical protein